MAPAVALALGVPDPPVFPLLLPPLPPELPPPPIDNGWSPACLRPAASSATTCSVFAGVVGVPPPAVPPVLPPPPGGAGGCGALPAPEEPRMLQAGGQSGAKRARQEGQQKSGACACLTGPGLGCAVSAGMHGCCCTGSPGKKWANRQASRGGGACAGRGTGASGGSSAAAGLYYLVPIHECRQPRHVSRATHRVAGGDKAGGSQSLEAQLLG